MTESTSVPEKSSKLSATERLTLIRTLNALPSPQFEELLCALNPPNANIPSETAPQASRSKALLQWIESPLGPGISELETILGMIIATPSQTSPEFLSFAISGKISSKTVAEVRAIVELLRKKTGDDSIDVAFFKEGSIKIILSGSSEGLEKLKELFESDEFEELRISPVESINSVDNTTTDARKARLIQALRLEDYRSITTDLNLASTLARALDQDRYFDIEHALDRARALDLYLYIVSDLTHDKNLGHASHRAREVARYLALASGRASYRDRNLNSDLNSDRDRAREVASNLYLSLNRAIDRGLDNKLTQALDHASSNYFARYLASTRYLYRDRQFDLRLTDLSNTNLSNVDLRQADLTEVNLTRADLTRANLTGAILSGAILSEADVTETVFGGNQGLTEADKLDLQQRGAIILDPPSSDVPDLIPV